MAEEIEGARCKFGDEAATAHCGRCGAAFCALHGRDGLCHDCRSPLSLAPSGTLYRGSLIAVAVAGVLGIWALVAPPTLPGEHRKAASAAQNPAAVQPQPRQSNAASVVPTPILFSPTATPPVVRTYTVAFGDTLAGIAQSFSTTVSAIEDANPGVTPATLKAGQQLLIPPPPTPTPSVTPTPSPSPTPSPTPTASPSPSPSPTPSPTPAPTDSPTPTPTSAPATPTPTPTAAPSATPAQ